MQELRLIYPRLVVNYKYIYLKILFNFKSAATIHFINTIPFLFFVVFLKKQYKIKNM